MNKFQPTEDTPLQFTELHFMDDKNVEDLQEWVDKDELTPIIDEQAGGIIGYIHKFHSDRILNTLNKLA